MDRAPFPTIDLHCDTVWRLQQGMPFDDRASYSHVSLPRMQLAGYTLQVFACFVDDRVSSYGIADTVDYLLDTLDDTCRKHDTDLTPVRSLAEAQEAERTGRIGALYAIENGLAIENSLEKLRHFYDRGVRMMTLTHNGSNDWCIASGDKSPAFNGLTQFGREVIGAMEEMGMMVDLSHVGPTGVTEVLKIARRPVVASHSCVRALCDHHRNLTDDQIRAIADTRGMIGINFLGDFLSPDWQRVSADFIAQHKEIDEEVARHYFDRCSREEYLQVVEPMMPVINEYERRIRATGAGIPTVADHIEYIVNLVGDEFVGLGSDYDGIPFGPNNLEDCSKLPQLADELIRRGYTEQTIRRIFHDNFHRVLGAVCG